MGKVFRFNVHPHAKACFLIVLFLWAFLLSLPGRSLAAEADLEKDLQTSLEQSKTTILAIQKKLSSGTSVAPELEQIRSAAENIRITHLLLEERFRLRAEKVKSLGPKALDRHEAMVDGYREALAEYLALIDKLPSKGTINQSSADKLRALLDTLLPKRKRPLIGSLPYKHLNYPSQEPSPAPAITPAYKGGNKTVSPDDTKATPEAPISKPIAELAQSFNWQPVAAYEYVKNEIATEWYWGCQKGAEETLRQKSGNDCDQALLLASLLRSSGFPTRLVRGTIEFFASGKDEPINRVKMLTGIDDPNKIAEFFQKAGIPNKPVIQGGKIANFQIEHIWVEAQIPMANYRGIVIDDHGKSWLGLDTSIKVKGYTYNQAEDIFENAALSSQLSAVRDEYLGLATASTASTPFELNQTPLEYLKAAIEQQSAIRNPQSEIRYADFLRTRTLIPEVQNILPSSMQFTLIKATNEYTALPDELLHKVRFIATRNAQPETPLFDVTLPLYQLSNQRIAIGYEPETVEDQEIIDSYGGLDNTPAYLVRLRPMLKLNGERTVVAKDGLPMGAEYSLTIEMTGASGVQSSEKITNTQIIGNLSVIGIVAQRAVSHQLSADGLELNAESLLFQEANHYIDRWNQAEDELASLLHLSISRPLPAVVTLGGIIDVTYLLGTPHGFKWKGVFVDAGLRRIETVRSSESGVRSEGEREKLFMQLSSLQGSVLENRIFEDDFQVQSISTAKLIQISNQQSAEGGQLLAIDKTNIDALLPTLAYDENIKEDIMNAVNQNLTIRIPQAEMTYQDWSGIGYIKENIETGESGWMLSGMIAGGMTAAEQWVDDQLQALLGHPFTGVANMNPLTGQNLVKIPVTDLQRGIVNNTLPKPLAVYYSDTKGMPVKGAVVTFSLLTGKGRLKCLHPPADQPAAATCSAQTGTYGIAEAELTLGEHTGDNPAFAMTVHDDTYFTQVGLHLVTASVAGNSGEISLSQPFTAYSKPDVSDPQTVVMEKLIPSAEVTAVLPDNPGGSLAVLVKDKYGNPISNARVTFAVGPHTSTLTLPTEEKGFKDLRLYKTEDCANPYPLREDCAAALKSTIDEIPTDYSGVHVDTMIGNAMSTRFTVDVSAAGYPNAKATFTLSTESFKRKDNRYMLSTMLIRALAIVDPVSGKILTASKAGTALKAPVTAELILLEEEEAPLEWHLIPNETQYIAWNIVPTNLTRARKVTDGTVTFTPGTGNGSATPTINLGDGKYQTTYTTGSTPALNTIEAEGSAIITTPKIFQGDCPDSTTDLVAQTVCGATKDYYLPNFATVAQAQSLLRPLTTRDLPSMTETIKTGYSMYYGEDTDGKVRPIITDIAWLTSDGAGNCTGVGRYEKTITYAVYGVDVALTVTPPLTLLDDRGYSASDITLSYSILPAEYKALDASIDIFEIPQNCTESWHDVLWAKNTQGQGTATQIKGSAFDVNTLYKAQAVINRGTNMEIRSKTEINADNIGNDDSMCEKGEACEDKVRIHLAQIRVADENNSLVDEVKFSDGSNNSKGTKKYHVEIKSPSWISACDNLTGKIVTLSTAPATAGQPVSTPGGSAYASEHPLHFSPADGKCVPRITDTADSYSYKDKFIISNRPRADLDVGFPSNISKTAVLYAGLGNNLMIEVGGIRKVLPIEPVGVVVLGIDGLRQDVLYNAGEAQVHDSTGDYHVSAALDLKGFCQVLGGKKSGLFSITSCDTTGYEDKNIKLQNVTTIFPSITFAAWASIFTGKLPNETGITGNEFFARDVYSLSFRIPGLESLPSGMVTLDADGGAFRPIIDGREPSWLDSVKSLDFILMNVMPAEFTPFNMTTMPVKLDHSAPGHALRAEATPLWEDINTIVNKRYQTNKSLGTRCDKNNYECRTVTMFNQYAEGADWWGTPGDLSSPLLETAQQLLWPGPSYSSELMDSFSADETAGFINKYFSNKTTEGKKKKFPALLSVYLPGLDHYAHIEGMEGYRSYFTSVTDAKVDKIVEALKDNDEFDNKIFIVVSDHGETAMPTDLTYKSKWLGADVDRKAEMSCVLKTDFGDTENPDMGAQNAELNNNSLHIWELGQMFKAIGDSGATQYKVLAPQSVANLFTGVTSTGLRYELPYGATASIDNANVIAALNGPMAHIYLKGDDGWADEEPDIVHLTIFAKYIKRYTQEGGMNIDDNDIKILFNKLLFSVDRILIRVDDVYKDFNGVVADVSGGVTGPNAATISETYFDANAYVSAFNRIDKMNHLKRSGDIVLVMKDSTTGSVSDRYSTAYACKSWHGSLNPSDSYVPFIVSYPGGNKAEMQSFIDTTPGCNSTTGCDGNWKVTDLIKTIIQKQYGTQ